MADRQGETAPGQAGFDPRFPARFQPGYDAAQDAGGRPDPEVQSSGALSRPTQGRAGSSQATQGQAVRDHAALSRPPQGEAVQDQAAPGRTMQGTTRIAAPEPTPPRAEARHAAASAEAPQAEQAPGITVLGFTPGVSVTGHSTPPATRRIRRSWWGRVNPYLVLLLVLGIAFIVGAIEWARTFVLGADYFSSGPMDQFQVVMMQFSLFGVPMLFVLGLATLTAVVAILAVQWPGRRQNEETSSPSAAPPPAPAP